jgi:DNA-directed RNA polymerase subunit omega
MSAEKNKDNEKPTDKDQGNIDSKYRLIHVAAKRARQIQKGSSPQVDTDTTKATKMAMDEVKAGKVEWSIPADNEADQQNEAPEPSGEEGKSQE